MLRKRKTLSQPTLDGSQFIKRSRRRNDDEASTSQSQTIADGRAGRVLRIYLQNFMCHSSLEIKFDPNTNYIVGRNGSGKSAILTALIVGLGGKARTTNRGSSMKSFIKVGEASAMVEITLSNTGPMAYNPKVYGNEITVIRTFSENGGNSYRMKSVAGETISSAFRDINRLIDALNIHVDNPVCILNQDVARTFLNSNDPAKKYIMFMKATNLENVKFQYKIALKNKKQNLLLLKAKVESMQKLEKEVKKWLNKYKAFDIMGEIEAKKKNLELEAVWAQINVIKQELSQKESAVEQITKEVQQFEDLVKNKADRKKNLTESIEQIRQQLMEIRNEEEINQQAMNSKKVQLHKFRETVVAKQNDVVATEKTIARKKIDLKSIEDEISNSSEHHSNRLKMIEDRDKQMVSLERKSFEISKMKETATHDLTQTRNALRLKQQDENNIRAEIDEFTGKISQRQARIRSMRADENNSVSVYGGNMHRIVQSINAHKEQFVKLPRGPLGSYIKLKDKKWALAVEDLLSQSMLMSFCVDNHKDAKILQRIFADVCGNSRKPTIICSKFYEKIHNYSRYKVNAPNECTSVIDALIIRDPIVTNCLIDQSSIETVLLIPTNALARQLMSEAARVPKYCSKAVTLTGDQFYPDPNYRSYACRSRNARFLQVSTTEAIRFYEQEVQNLIQNQETAQRQLQAFSDEVRRLTSDVKAIENKLSKFETAQSRVQRDINDLKLLNLPPEPNIQILTEELGEIKRIIESKENELQKLKEDAQGIKSKLKDTESEYNLLRQTSKGLETRMTPLLNEINESENKLKQITINAKFHAEKIKTCKDKITDARREFERKENTLKEKLEAAERLGPHMEADRSLEAVLTELQETDHQLTEIKTSMGDRLTVSQTYMRMQAKYDKTKNEVSKVQACLDQMVSTVESRARHYQKLAEYIGVRVREMFTGVLKIRQFKGTIEIDHDKQTLELIVIPQHGSSQGSGHTHILSGGERSYSTVAFLHALWQVMEYPFYFLDEFDVFMDKVNRRTVMDILLEHAKEHSDLQFVFLTPQDISGVVGDKNITVHRMADPR